MNRTDRNNPPHRNLSTGTVVAEYAATAIAAVTAFVIVVLASTGPEPMPDFGAIERIPARKQAFFEYLAPIVRDENQRVMAQRRRLLEIEGRAERGEGPGWLDRGWLADLSDEYGVEWSPEEPLARIERLKKRVDRVPVPLALVQAATESGWGRSRFAVEGNNLFGHWCYSPGCGLVPARRNASAAHEVAAFDSVRQSVARYLHNLNTHDAYAPLRAIRARLRRSDAQLTAMALAEGLVHYSERREAYVEDIQAVIRVNRPILERIGVSL